MLVCYGQRIRSTSYGKPTKALLTLLKTDPSQVDSLSIQQVVALCGTGKLTDNSESSTDLRGYLQIAKSENLFTYVQSCLQSPFDRSGSVLQDLVNELGRRLDYSVQNGLYQGKTNAVGFDGLWTSPEGRVIVVEVKTTDAYRINLDTIAGYREKLLASGTIPKESSVLLVVGREDTGDLEAQVRGSKHAWTFRIISADALTKLVVLKENAEVASAGKIHELLVPFEYTRLDKIIEIAFTVAEDASAAAVEDEQGPDVEVTVEPSDKVTAGTVRSQQHTPSAIISEVRTEIVRSISNTYVPLVKKSRALYWSADKSLRAAITISKEYEGGDYWYAYHPAWDAFLSEAATGFFVLGCVGRDEAFAIPFGWIHCRLNSFYTTERDDNRYWHILLWPAEDGEMVLRLKDGSSESLDSFKLPLTKVKSPAI